MLSQTIIATDVGIGTTTQTMLVLIWWLAKKQDYASVDFQPAGFYVLLHKVRDVQSWKCHLQFNFLIGSMYECSHTRARQEADMSRIICNPSGGSTPMVWIIGREVVRGASTTDLSPVQAKPMSTSRILISRKRIAKDSRMDPESDVRWIHQSPPKS